MSANSDPPQRRYLRWLWQQLKRPWVVRLAFFLAKLLINLLRDP